jgi:2'-5' RNA ligase
MRLFLAIPLAPAVISELAAISMRLRSAADGMRWSAPESWHITLKFLGKTEQAQSDCLTGRLRELHLPPVPVRLKGLGCFDRSGILFAGVTVSAEMQELHRRVTQATEQCGFVPEARAFHPHITLARGKRDGSRQSLAELKNKIPRATTFTHFAANEFVLYESFLGAGGSRYEIRARFQLAGH